MVLAHAVTRRCACTTTRAWCSFIRPTSSSLDEVAQVTLPLPPFAPDLRSRRGQSLKADLPQLAAKTTRNAACYQALRKILADK